ncbi:MAG: PilT/PilU family type 4a pilus ATPase [Dehalococcoidales bacterium]|nr:PilT/PilU family type 4a pilus ATPase [Dehalococcoidales bacterium]
MDIYPIVQIALANGASDLHLIPSSPPMMRIEGALQPVEGMQPLSADDINQALRQVTSDEERADFEENLELDFSRTLRNIGRIRCNASKQRGMTSLALRLVPSVIPSLSELGLPEICKELALKPRGLVVVSGPTGSGKSTTLSAMINYLNGMERRRVVTIEDPIEYIYSNNHCTITQRELGNDTHSFTQALKHVLRQDPDVILVGEMRDYETAAAVLTVAETGHLVLTTGHATSAAQAVERIIDLFPSHERSLVQARLASFLIAILCQALVPKAEGPGRVAAVEVMVACPAVRNIIREGKIYQLPNTMVTQAQMGMVTLDHALVKLYKKGVINFDSMLAVCNDPDEVGKLITKT